MKIGVRVLWGLCSLLLMLTSMPGIIVRAQEPTPAEALLNSMTAEERIGQLFLVTFAGPQVDEESQIHALISKYHVGGVVLKAENNNFSVEDPAASVQALTKTLQEVAWQAASEGASVKEIGKANEQAYVPLLIGLEQLGNGYPTDQILSGMTEFPSQMALGASWDPSLSNRVGELLGEELSTLGINLLLGPNLAVLEDPNNEAANYLNVNAYGGNPFWVGAMGKAYISGLHTGSNNRLLVAAQNFPGSGSADRPPDIEISTIRKSLEQLRKVELAPYIAVTTHAPGTPERVDALMVSHNRYQGFQGNIRAATRPISFDTNGLQMLMALPEFNAWQESGGLLISQSLGNAAVRRFFDPNDNNFEARQLARNAFLAGSDILFVDNFIATGDPDSFTTIVSTIISFVQKYREDPAFAKLVDTSVLRILMAKMKIYNDFSLNQVNKLSGNLSTLGSAQEVNFDVAQAAVTLINPSPQELDALLTSPPIWSDHVLIFTDARKFAQCDKCPVTSDVPNSAFADALIRLYGPQAGGQIQQNRLASFSFTQLKEFLDVEESETKELITASFRSAKWIIFNTQGIGINYPSTDALKRVLTERPDLLTGKNVIVFDLGAPIFLDATDLSKISAYYALFSKTSAFFDVAVRVFMQEYEPAGALPISLNATGYDLQQMTLPNPNQVIRLELVISESEGELQVEPPYEVEDVPPNIEVTPAPTIEPSFNVGDMVTIRTLPILDHNQNPVPDDTLVRFNFHTSGEPGSTRQFEAPTVDGVAFINYRVEAAGGIVVTANSGPAILSETLQINISPEGIMSIFSFTPIPTISPTPIEPTPTPTIMPTQLPTLTSTPEPEIVDYPSLGDWALGMLVMGIGGAITFSIGLLWWGSFRWGLRSSLSALIGGFISYSYLNLGFEGTKIWMQQAGTRFVIEVVVVGLLLGWIAALIWWMRTEGMRPNRNHR